MGRVTAHPFRHRPEHGGSDSLSGLFVQNFLGKGNGELIGFPRLVSFHHCLVFIFVSKFLWTEGHKG